MVPEAELEFFQDIPLFGGLGKEALQLLLNTAPTVSVSKGQALFREGEEAKSMFVLQSGKVVILKRWRDHDYVLRHLGPKDCFGEMALMDLGPRSASVLAVEDCTALELSGQTLDQLYKTYPEQYTMLHMNMGREVSRRLREANRQLFEAKVEAKLIDGHFHFYVT